MEMVHFIPSSQRRIAMQAAQDDAAACLILGSSGTGKGAIGRWIHQNSPRSMRPFAIANHDAPLIKQIPAAQGGTLMVTEIGEYGLGDQKVLLDFIKTRSVPHPDNPALKMLANVRIIATTSQSLEGRAQGGVFNAELLEKLSRFRIDMPNLSQRADEFQDIVASLLDEIRYELHKEHVRSVTSEAMRQLQAYEWPGNVRELRNVLRYAVVHCQGDRIELAGLPDLTQDKVDFRATRETFERIYLVELLKSHHWQLDKVTRTSRISKNVLLDKIKHLGIELPEQTP